MSAREKTLDRPTNPDLKAAIGEDPARWLSRETSLSPIPRIRGMTDLGTANMWIQVAREIDCPNRYLDALESRRDFLVQQLGGEPSDG